MNTGICECGCGGKTGIAVESSTEKGWVRGQPKRFIKNHHVRGRHNWRWNGGTTSVSGYKMLATNKKNPSGGTKYKFEHVLVAERLLGRELPEGAQVHHVNGIITDNRPCNLVLCQDAAYHKLLHLRARALKECGHANWRKCCHCKRWDAPENLMMPKRARNSAKHRFCHAESERRRKSKLKGQNT
jgi:hypothetical protein